LQTHHWRGWTEHRNNRLPRSLKVWKRSLRRNARHQTGRITEFRKRVWGQLFDIPWTLPEFAISISRNSQNLIQDSWCHCIKARNRIHIRTFRQRKTCDKDQHRFNAMIEKFEGISGKTPLCFLDTSDLPHNRAPFSFLISCFFSRPIQECQD
jgi:hypothetical protein